MDDNKKLVINATGEKVELSNGIIELEDFTSIVFETESWNDFLQYIKKVAVEPIIFYDEKAASARIPGTPRFNETPIAICKFITEDVIELLQKINKKEMSLDELVMFLASMMAYSNETTLKVLDQLNDLSIKKVINIERQRDNKGNFSFGIKSEKHGKQDYDFPNELTFEVPIIRYLDKKIQLKFKFYFNYTVDSEGSFSLKFKAENLQLTTEIRIKHKEVIQESLKDFNGFSFFGTSKIEKKTDEWKYKINGIKGF